MNRLERVASEIKHEICRIIQTEIKDPRVGFVTITSVDVSPDLQNAKVYFTSLGDEARQKASREALKSAAGFIRKQLAARLKIRRTPALDFKMDKPPEYNSSIDEIFKKIEEERKNNAD